MMPQMSNMILNSTTFVMIIMIVLAIFSVISWALFFERIFFMKNISSEINNMTKSASNSSSFSDFVRYIKAGDFNIISFFKDLIEGVVLLKF